MHPPPAYSRRSVLQGVFVRPARNIVQARGVTGTSKAIQQRPGVEAFPVNMTPKSGGWPLPRDVQAKMESALGANFSDVRIYVGPEVAAIGAIAFTWGSDIHFAPGQYNPHTPAGQSLLGHELTHVVQQRAGRLANPFGSGVAVVQDQALEAEADRMGRQAAAHRPAGIGADHTSAPYPAHTRFAVQSKPPAVARVAARTSLAQPTGNPAAFKAPGRSVFLSIQLSGQHTPLTRAPFAGRPLSGVRPGVVQRVSLNITTLHADESQAVVKDLVFNGRPPVDGDVKREVRIRNYNKTDGVAWQVGHKIGWDVIADHYRRQFAGKTIQELSDYFQSQSINSRPTIDSVETCMGIWIDSDYKANFEGNEFPQPSGGNLSAGGTVPHAKSDYVDEYKKKIRSRGNPDHRDKKRKFIASQVNWDKGAGKEEKAEIYTQFKPLWNAQYPQSPLRKTDFG